MANENLVFLSNVRLSFPHIAEPQVQKGDKGERKTYNAEFILGPNDPGWMKFWEVVNRLAVEKWKDKAPNVLQMVQQDHKKRCFGWGQQKINSKTFVVYDGYEGMVFIGAQRKATDGMPQVIDPQGQAIPPDNPMAVQNAARKLYGGCYVNAVVKPWLQENKHGYGIRGELIAVQFFADGTPFGEGNIDASELFGATPQAPAPGATPPWMGQAPAGAPTPAWGAPGVPGMPGAPLPGVQQPGMAMPAPPFPTPAATPSFLR